MAMNLAPKNKVDPSFNMSSMTDLIFLLLIFFILTSNFATPSGITVSLPKTQHATKLIATINVTITENLEYYVERIIIPAENLEQDLKELIGDQKDVVVVLHVDKTVPVQYLMTVAGIAAKYKAKVSIAAQKES